MAFAAAVVRATLAGLSCVYLISVVTAKTETNRLPNISGAKIIELGSSISPNDTSTSPYWVSPSGIFAFGFYPHEAASRFAIGIWMLTPPNNVIVWTCPNKNGSAQPLPSNATLELTTQGLILRTRDDHPLIDLHTDDDDGRPISKRITSAALFDSGNFVLYGNNVSDVIWRSFDSPTDTILGGQHLIQEKDQLVSTGLGYRLSWQRDGNLVLYAPNSFSRPENAYWDAGAPHDGDLCLSSNGVLYFSKQISFNSSRCQFSEFKILAKDTTGYNPSESGDTTVVYRATLDADGIFRLYSHHIQSNKSSNVSTVWSNLQNQCDVKGFCGLNSFCYGDGKRGDCYCYPGFAFINASTKSLGCYRNFSDHGCRPEEEEQQRFICSMSILENMTWGDYPYLVTQIPSKQLCSNFCLEDCNCWAALYRSPTCSKYRLPLRYGERNSNISATALFKVVSGKFSDTKHDAAPPPRSETENNTVLVLAFSLGFVTFMFFVFAASSFLIYKHRLYRYNRLFENANVGLAEDFSLQSFSYNELERATNGFREELGRGSFGAVYKGTTLSGCNKAIAVKRLENAAEEGIQEFRAEMTIGRTHHRNLVQLLGFCIEGSKKLLVYEFMSNGSLADLLFKASVRPAWKERVRFTLEVARGLLYLHEECGVHIIHCNLKPQNILLDDTLTAKISDFGFARLQMPKQAKGLMGVEESTRSYFAPEWKKNALISVKSDIYSFGIVLLEIICCRRSIDVNVPSPDEIALSDWVCDCFWAEELNKLVELDEDVHMRTLERMVKVGIWCIQENPDLRPSMKNVILMLEGTMDIPLPPPKLS